MIWLALALAWTAAMGLLLWLWDQHYKIVEPRDDETLYGDNISIPSEAIPFPRKGAPDRKVDVWEFLQEIGVEEAKRRLDARADKSGDCWIIGSVGKYARVEFRGRCVAAHRLAWAVANNSDPGELFVCHTCDVRSCCNPSHLFLGTASDNARDMWAKGRQSGAADKSSVGRTNRQEAKERGDARNAAQIIRWANILSDPRGVTEVAGAYGIGRHQVRRIRMGITSGQAGTKPSTSLANLAVVVVRGNKSGEVT